MNKIASIKLPILALAMVFTISCSSDKDSGENLGSGGENSNVSNEQGSSSSFVQSSSSGIPDMCCPNVCHDLSDFTVRYLSDECIQPEFEGGEYRCPPGGAICPPNESSSSSLVQSSSSGINNCAPPQIVPMVVGTGTEYVTGCAILEPHFTDARDGKTYRYAEIGTQTWMAENLKYAAEGSKCGTDVVKGGYYYELSDANTAFCDTYGRLYNWTTAMEICPVGWHLPSDAEWEALMTAVGGVATAGKYLKANHNWYDEEGNPAGNGEDKYRFRALPGGYGSSSGYFGSAGNTGYWWSASEKDANDVYSSAYTYRMHSNLDGVSHIMDGKSELRSIRCVKN